MDPSLKFILIGCFGSFCQEVMYWRELSGQLDNPQFEKLIRSKTYWIMAFLVVLVSGFGCFFLCFEDGMSKMQTPFILGAGFPALFKKAVQSRAQQDLGAKSLIKDYFQI